MAVLAYVSIGQNRKGHTSNTDRHFKLKKKKRKTDNERYFSALIFITPSEKNTS